MALPPAAAFGVAIIFKYPAILILPACVVIAGRRRWPIFVAAVAVPTLPMISPFLPFLHHPSADTVVFQSSRNASPIGIRILGVLLYGVLLQPLGFFGLWMKPRRWWLVAGYVSGFAYVATTQVYYHYMVPLVPFASILGAIYLNEYGGKNWLAALIGFFSDVMTGVPSIIMGLFIFTIWVLHFGLSGLAGAFALGCLMLPVVIRSSYEMLRLVPDPLREASYALGATKSRVTLTVVLPSAVGGIVSGALLAIARVAGETAPLLFTALGSQYFSFNLNQPMAALPLTVFNYATGPYEEWHQYAWAAALVLILVVFVLSLGARLAIRNRFSLNG